MTAMFPQWYGLLIRYIVVHMYLGQSWRLCRLCWPKMQWISKNSHECLIHLINGLRLSSQLYRTGFSVQVAWGWESTFHHSCSEAMQAKAMFAWKWLSKFQTWDFSTAVGCAQSTLGHEGRIFTGHVKQTHAVPRIDSIDNIDLNGPIALHQFQYKATASYARISWHYAITGL